MTYNTEMENLFKVEICCGDISSVYAARDGGAKRIELCSGLSEGGLTPSIGLIEMAVESGIEEVNVLIRPRPGDFLYSEAELKLMTEDIRHAVAAGATGIVTGVLKDDGEIDMDAMKYLITAAKDEGIKKNKEVAITFHRAFDVSADPMKSLKDIISLGCDTLLTSGMAANAVEGIGVIRRLVENAGDEIMIMAGAGVNPSNVADIIASTGVKAIHSTAREPVACKMSFRRRGVNMGIPGLDEYSILATTPRIVNQLIKNIQR